jgi:hypothetical protein
VPGLSQINTTLNGVYCNFQCGVTIGISVPTTISLSNLTTNSDKANWTVSVDSAENNVFSYNTGYTATPSAFESVDATLEHAPGFELSLGLYTSLSICKVFSVSGSVSFELLSALGITVTAGPYYNTVPGLPSNVSTQTTRQSCAPKPLRVVFAPDLATA